MSLYVFTEQIAFDKTDKKGYNSSVMVEMVGNSLSSVADKLCLDKKTLRRWIADGFIKHTKLPGGQYRISNGEVERIRRLLSGEPEETQDNP